jgi:hypothetical protein
MPDRRISQLPAASTPLAGTEIVPLVQGGVTSRATAQDIADLGGGGGAFATALALINNVGDFIQTYHPGVDSVIWSCGAPGEYQVNFTPDYFSINSSPCISCAMFENTPKVSYELISFDNQQCTLRIFAIDDGTPTDMPFSIMAIGEPGP